MNSRYRVRLPALRLAHASTIVTDEAIRISVLSAASGTLRIADWSGQLSAPIRSRAYAENSDPNSITSDARNSQIPSFGFVRPVSGRTSVVYGMSISAPPRPRYYRRV